VKRAVPKRPTVLIFMGVAGSGKTTVAKLFAKKTGAVFYEGDDFHPPENVAKMRAGIPLTDADREKWLRTLRKIIVRALAKKEFSALACSALKAKYRDQLSEGDPQVKFVHLAGRPDLIEKRMKTRRGHFMPATLLKSQFAILEQPVDALTASCEKSPASIVAELVQIFGIAVPG
jgi:gluconokinase